MAAEDRGGPGERRPMPKLQIARHVLTKTKERSNLTHEERQVVEGLLGDTNGKGAVAASLNELPLAFLKALLDDNRLTPNQRAAIVMHVHGMSASRIDRDQIYDTTVSNPVEFGSAFMALGGRSPNVELFLNGRWYPSGVERSVLARRGGQAPQQGV